MLGENKSSRALLVIDMTDQFAHKDGQCYVAASEEIIPFIHGELQYFRERMRPIIFCSARESGPVIRELSPRRGEFCLEKNYANAFLDTNLNYILFEQKVKNLTIVGLQFYKSVLLTAGAALEQGFSVVIPETCVCSDLEQDHMAALRLFDRWSKDLDMNININLKADNS